MVGYDILLTRANKLASIVNNLDLIKEFRSMSNDIKHNNLGGSFVGPMGHKYPIDNDQFGSSFSKYLQNFEFALITNSTVETCHNGNFLQQYYYIIFMMVILLLVKLMTNKNFSRN